MKILEVIQSLGSGGAERLVVDLCNEMVKTQEVYLLVLKEADMFYLPQVSPDVHVIQAHLPIGKDLKQFYISYKIIRDIAPDIVHFHSQARFTVLPANLLLHRRYKFFMTIHSDVKDGYWKGISGLQVKMSGLLGKTRFITISPTNFQQFKELYPSFKQKMIKNGRALPDRINITDIKREIEVYQTDDNTIVFIHIARCSEVKNQKLLIESFNQIVERGYNAILLIIGSGFDSTLGKALKEKACSNIHFLGTKERIYDYLACSDVFLLSSLVEGMPMSIIEALLSGIPVISTPVCGAIDAVINGENGLISPDFSVVHYTETIIEGILKLDVLKQKAFTQSKQSPWGIRYCVEQYLDWFIN